MYRSMLCGSDACLQIEALTFVTAATLPLYCSITSGSAKVMLLSTFTCVTHSAKHNCFDSCSKNTFPILTSRSVRQRQCRTQPERTLYLAFGHDEEVGGDMGAGAMASLLASRGVTLDFVVDEGGPILVDGLPSLLRTPTQIALVGTAEKVLCLYNLLLA